MHRLPFASQAGIGASGVPSTSTIASAYERKVSLRGFQLYCPAIPAVTGAATLTVAGLTDSTQPGGGIGSGSLTFMFTPSVSQPSAVSFDFPEGCVESPGPMTFTLTPNGSDDLGNSLVTYWGQLVPAGQ